jgi:HPr kinase/phosphorylase
MRMSDPLRTSEVGLEAVRGQLVAGRDVLGHADLKELLTLRAGQGGLSRPITHPRVQKSGLVLVGHSQGVVPSRIQVLGETEVSYLETLAAEERLQRIAFLFSLDMSLIVVTRGIAPLPELVEAAERTQTPLAVSDVRSSVTINRLHAALDRLLAPCMDLHGVFVEVHGIGTLLRGPSGIGKSECALFLVERGHRLVADDVVQLTCLPQGQIMGQAAPLLRHHLEIRGLGILNVRDLYGATAVCDEARLDLIVDLSPWDARAEYDRLGIDDETIDVLGQAICRLRVPVHPGRDMGVILEIASRNHLLRREGVNGAARFSERLEQARDERRKT